MAGDDGIELVGVQIVEDLGERLLEWIDAERERLTALGELRGRPGLAILDRFELQIYELAESGTEHAALFAWGRHGHVRAEIAEAEIARRDEIEREQAREAKAT